MNDGRAKLTSISSIDFHHGRFPLGGRGSFIKRGNNSQQFCAGCFIDYKHRPSECSRQEAVARLLQIDDDTNEDDFNEADFNDEDGKNNSYKNEKLPVLNHFQNNQDYVSKSTQETTNNPANLTLTINLNQNP